MKVLIVSRYFPPSTGGAPTLMYNLCKYLPKDSFTVITTSAEMDKCDREYVLDCHAIRLPGHSGRRFDSLKFFLLAIVRGLSVSRIERTDCFLAVYPSEFDLYAAYVLRKLTRKPLLLYMHDLFSENVPRAKLRSLLKFVENRVFSSASAIIVTNEKFKDHYTRRGIRNVVVFHSCVDLSVYGRAEMQNIAPSHQNLRIVFTGKIRETNEDAILFFSNAVKERTDLDIVFATSSQAPYLDKFSIGFVSKKQCPELQKSADVLLLPLAFKTSFREEINIAFPCKMLEYLAVGRPILAIAPKDSFVANFVERNSVGIALTSLSEEKIAAAIDRLKDEQTRKNFSENALKIVKSFDAKTQADRLLSIIRLVVRKTSSSENCD